MRVVLPKSRTVSLSTECSSSSSSNALTNKTAKILDNSTTLSIDPSDTNDDEQILFLETAESISSDPNQSVTSADDSTVFGMADSNLVSDNEHDDSRYVQCRLD